MREYKITSFLLKKVKVKKNGKATKANRFVATDRVITNIPSFQHVIERMSKEGFDKIEI